MEGCVVTLLLLVEDVGMSFISDLKRGDSL